MLLGTQAVLNEMVGVETDLVVQVGDGIQLILSGDWFRDGLKTFCHGN